MSSCICLSDGQLRVQRSGLASWSAFLTDVEASGPWALGFSLPALVTTWDSDDDGWRLLVRLLLQESEPLDDVDAAGLWFIGHSGRRDPSSSCWCPPGLLVLLVTPDMLEDARQMQQPAGKPASPTQCMLAHLLALTTLLSSQLILHVQASLAAPAAATLLTSLTTAAQQLLMCGSMRSLFHADLPSLVHVLRDAPAMLVKATAAGHPGCRSALHDELNSWAAAHGSARAAAGTGSSGSHGDATVQHVRTLQARLFPEQDMMAMPAANVSTLPAHAAAPAASASRAPSMAQRSLQLASPSTQGTVVADGPVCIWKREARLVTEGPVCMWNRPTANCTDSGNTPLQTKKSVAAGALVSRPSHAPAAGLAAGNHDGDVDLPPSSSMRGMGLHGEGARSVGGTTLRSRASSIKPPPPEPTTLPAVSAAFAASVSRLASVLAASQVLRRAKSVMGRTLTPRTMKSLVHVYTSMVTHAGNVAALGGASAMGAGRVQRRGVSAAPSRQQLAASRPAANSAQDCPPGPSKSRAASPVGGAEQQAAASSPRPEVSDGVALGPVPSLPQVWDALVHLECEGAVALAVADHQERLEAVLTCAQDVVCAPVVQQQNWEVTRRQYLDATTHMHSNASARGLRDLRKQCDAVYQPLVAHLRSPAAEDRGPGRLKPRPSYGGGVLGAQRAVTGPAAQAGEVGSPRGDGSPTPPRASIARTARVRQLLQTSSLGLLVDQHSREKLEHADQLGHVHACYAFLPRLDSPRSPHAAGASQLQRSRSSVTSQSVLHLPGELGRPGVPTLASVGTTAKQPGADSSCASSGLLAGPLQPRRSRHLSLGGTQDLDLAGCSAQVQDLVRSWDALTLHARDTQARARRLPALRPTLPSP